MEEIELLEEQESKDYLAKLLEVLKESTKTSLRCPSAPPSLSVSSAGHHFEASFRSPSG